MQFLFLLGFLLASCNAFAGEKLSVNQERAVGIDTEIARNMGAIQTRMLALASDKTGEPVDIIIDSPGEIGRAHV